MSFKAGDLVKLKSGGPVMTVEHAGEKAMTEEDLVWCVWFEKAGSKQNLQRDTFAPAVLEMADESGSGAVRLTRT